MIDLERVNELFRLFAGERELLGAWEILCRSAAAGLECRLRAAAGEGPADREAAERLCMAAAAWAYGDYLALESAGGGGELRVGNISVKEGRSAASREAGVLRDYFLAGVADLLEPECRPLLAVEERPKLPATEGTQ